MATGKIEGEGSERNKVFARKGQSIPQKSNFVPHQTRVATTTTTDRKNSSHHLPLQTLDVVASDDSSSRNRMHQGSQKAANGIAKSGYVRHNNLVKINLNVLSKDEARGLKRKLASELEQVRGLVKKFEAKESRFSGGYANSPVSGNENVVKGSGSLVRVNSDVGSVGLPNSRHNQGLSVSVAEQDHNGSQFVDKEKRMTNVNQYNKNSEFALGKEKLRPTENTKKMKPSVGKTNGSQMGGKITPEKFPSKLFKHCTDLLGKLMKHKYGWPFNNPVDVKGLGLHDYHTIIKHPMDLGTVKTRLNTNWYKSPREFAEDVRLTFSNAMLYNPKEQDAHIMACQLLAMFEEKWKAVESEYNPNRRVERSHDPTSRRVPAPDSAPVQTHAPTAAPAPLPLESRTLERSESMTMPADPKSTALDLTPTGSNAVLKKPKAKDPEKRDMTYEEKHRLSVNLQNLPTDKLDGVIQIIKKRNPALFQEDEEIELDIDNVDRETLWELDRYVTNYKKSLNKNKKNAEPALQASVEDDHSIQETNLEAPLLEVPKVAETVESIVPPSPIHGERQQNNEIQSSSSSSSGSDSGSSSSDSDRTDSSSE